MSLPFFHQVFNCSHLLLTLEAIIIRYFKPIFEPIPGYHYTVDRARFKLSNLLLELFNVCMSITWVDRFLQYFVKFFNANEQYTKIAREWSLTIISRNSLSWKLCMSWSSKTFLTKGLIHHNWHHILRDLARAVIIGEAEKANIKIVLASVLLHDIGRLYPDLWSDHHEAGALKAPEYLKKAGFKSEEIIEIAHCIRAHGPEEQRNPRLLRQK
jgi:hypothetical protein